MVKQVVKGFTGCRKITGHRAERTGSINIIVEMGYSSVDSQNIIIVLEQKYFKVTVVKVTVPVSK
jgi:hypothetical protein